MFLGLDGLLKREPWYLQGLLERGILIGRTFVTVEQTTEGAPANFQRRLQSFR